MLEPDENAVSQGKAALRGLKSHGYSPIIHLIVG